MVITFVPGCGLFHQFFTLDLDLNWGSDMF